MGALKEERGARKQTDGMPAGPFGSTSGVGRADAPWDELNLVKTTVGEDAIAKSATSNGRDPEATPEEALAMVGRGEDGLSEETYDVIIVGAGLSGATMAERLSKELDKKVLIIEKRDHIGAGSPGQVRPLHRGAGRNDANGAQCKKFREGRAHG